LAWLQLLALTNADTHPGARRWEHKRLRLPLLCIPARRSRKIEARRVAGTE